MKSKELAKIRSVMEDYRHYKLKFVQFGQHCEQLVQNAKLSELKVGEIKAREMAWSVMDLPITVRFGLVMTKEGQLLGKIDFEKSVPAAGEADRSIYTLYFDKTASSKKRVSAGRPSVTPYARASTRANLSRYSRGDSPVVFLNRRRKELLSS